MNSVGPKPTVSVSPDGGQPDRLAGVVRRRVPVAVDGADRSGVLAGGHPPGGRGPGLAAVRTSSSRLVGGDVEGDEVQPVLRRGDDAGLVLAR